MIKGDMFADSAATAFAFGVDARFAASGGVAAAAAKRFPSMLAECRERAATTPFQLGEVVAWTDDKHVVYNLVLQASPEDKPRLQALVRGLEGMMAAAEEAAVKRILLGRIGAGPKGLEWLRVRRLLEEVGRKSVVELCVFEQFVRARPGAADASGGAAGEFS